MSKFSYSKDLNDEQSEALQKAALLILKARKEAEEVLIRSGMQPPSEGGWFGNPCGATLPPPPPHHHCGCRNYKGDGGPCLPEYEDHLGPNFGTGYPKRTCGHLPVEHIET